MSSRIPSPRESGFTTSTAVPLYWTAYGAVGAPRLLLLHGGPGAHHDYMLPQMLRLAGSHELIFYDQRGGGRSKTNSREAITWQTHADDLRALVSEFGVEPVSLLGYSWGAMLALLYALAAYEDAASSPPQRMVLMSPAPLTREYRSEYEDEFDRRMAGNNVRTLREELATSGLRERDPAAYRQRGFELSVAGFFADPARARDLTPFKVTGRVQQSVWESLGDFDMLPRLSAIQCPTLILHGRADPIPLASSEAAARIMPNAKLVVLDSSGHVPYVEQPEELFSAIELFLADTAPGSHQ
ncbi:MAG: alpha/beta hydrolase [Gemmatimonadaceae bacterium]|nr:alpha/beta hydrolase [Gemmatimonadaceae bacterium]